MNICNVNGCEQKVRQKKLCGSHYMKWWRHGDPTWSKKIYGRTPTHISWTSMKQRCSNKNNPDYPRYGGRGIRYDARWDLFSNFLSDMGDRPEGMTLDRIDVNGDYTKSNCRWATREEQNYNQRNTLYIEYDGKRLNALEWEKITGISKHMIIRRIKSGWDVEKALYAKHRNKIKRKNHYPSIIYKRP